MAPRRVRLRVQTRETPRERPEPDLARRRREPRRAPGGRSEEDPRRSRSRVGSDPAGGSRAVSVRRVRDRADAVEVCDDEQHARSEELRHELVRGEVRGEADGVFEERARRGGEPQAFASGYAPNAYLAARLTSAKPSIARHRGDFRALAEPRAGATKEPATSARRTRFNRHTPVVSTMNSPTKRTKYPPPRSASATSASQASEANATESARSDAPVTAFSASKPSSTPRAPPPSSARRRAPPSSSSS